MQEYYKILGVSKDATEEEIDRAYNELKSRYSRERFYEGEIGNEAARNLTKLETAYTEIKAELHKGAKASESYNYDFSDIERLIKDGKLESAQSKLDDFSDRNAEWHYLQSVVFYKKNWTNESKKQLEIAMNMDPHNTKYADAYTKLKQKMEYNEKAFHSGNAGFNQGADDPQYSNNRQMGGCDCGSMAECCATWCCLNMLCNGCR